MMILIKKRTCIIYKNQRMSGYQFSVIECLPEVAVEKNKSFHCNRLIGGENESKIWSKRG